MFRPVTGNFYSRDSIAGTYSTDIIVRNFQWGSNGDKAFIGDRDADGKPDYTVFRPDVGNWYIHRSESNTLRHSTGVLIPMFHCFAKDIR